MNLSPLTGKATAARENDLGARKAAFPYWSNEELSRCLSSVACFSASQIVLDAQSLGTAGTVGGTVTDPSGAAVPKATVTIVNRVTNYRQATTTDNSECSD